jgi:hypothetical protein
MRNLVLAVFLLLSVSGIGDAQTERHASLPQGKEVDRQISREGRVEAAKARAEAADRKSAEAQVEAVRAGAEADRANQAGHDVGAARAEQRAAEAGRTADKAKAEAKEARDAYDRERRRP